MSLVSTTSASTTSASRGVGDGSGQVADDLGGGAELLEGLVGAGLEVALALVGGVDAEALAGLEVQVVQGQAAEDVVHDRLRHPDVGVVGEAGRLEAQVGELRDVGLQRARRTAGRCETAIEKASITPARVEPCLPSLRKTSPSSPSSWAPEVM